MELYIHIPFCVRKCRYCDFLSFASDACVREKYVDQLIREIESIPEEDAGQCSENAAPRLNLTGLLPMTKYSAVPASTIGG